MRLGRRRDRHPLGHRRQRRNARQHPAAVPLLDVLDREQALLPLEGAVIPTVRGRAAQQALKEVEQRRLFVATDPHGPARHPVGHTMGVPEAEQETGHVHLLGLGGLELGAYHTELVLDVDDRRDKRAGGGNRVPKPVSEGVVASGGLLEDCHRGFS